MKLLIDGYSKLFLLENKNSKLYQIKIDTIKLNSFSNFQPLSLTRKPFKVKININHKELMIIIIYQLLLNLINF